MAMFFDPVLRPATEKQCQICWQCAKPGERFRCYLCGHKFVPGDLFRPVYANGYKGEPAVGHGNFLVCGACDGPDVLDRWAAQCEEADRRFWWMA